MLQSNKSNEDPGGRFHNGQENRPLVRITNRNQEVVQQTPHLSFEFSQREMIRLREEMSRICNKGTAKGGGMVLHPPLELDEDDAIVGPAEGTVIHAYPVTYVDPAEADAFARHLEMRLDEYADKAGVSFHGFVASASRAVYERVAAAAKAEHARRFASLRKEEPGNAHDHPALKVITAEGVEEDVDPRTTAVELSHHETAAGHREQRQDGGDGVGARAVEA